MDLILKELNMEEFDSLKRSIWSPLRKHSIKPMEILPFIRGFSENDIDEITSAAKNRTKNESIDNLYEAIRRRNLDCFKSFLAALLEHEYVDLGKEILKIGKTILSNRNSPSLKTKEILTQVNNTQKSDQQNSKYTKKIPLTEETEIGKVSIKVTDRWAAELNKDKLWRELSKKMGFNKENVMEIEESDNAGDAFLDKLTKQRVKVGDMIKYLEGEKFFNFLQVIRQDLGESGYNNLNIDSSPVENAARFENVTLGLPRQNDSSNNLEGNIQNNVVDSPLQHSRNLSESGSPSWSGFAKTSKSENILNSSKQDMGFVTETGHTISYGSRKKSGQEEDQQSQMIPPSGSMSREGTENSDISSFIRNTQKEIALANKKKELDCSYSDTYQMEASEQPSSIGADSGHQTSPKSYFLDDNLNTYYLPAVNMRTSAQTTSQMDLLRPRAPVVHKDKYDAASQKESKLLQGIRDITNNLEQVGYEKKSHEGGHSGSSINITVQLASAAIEVGNPIAAPESSTNTSSQFDLFQSEPGLQSAENHMGSQQMQGLYRYPIPVSDDSDAKNLEMEASAYREDMTNQSNIVDYRDIQNSMPDQSLRSMDNREYHSSIVNQFCYSEGERSQSLDQSYSCNVPIDARESSERREGSTMGGISRAFSNCPSLNDSLLNNEETLTSNNNS